MPVYNAEGLLPETLDSIMAQTFGDFEIVISDNASMDATPAICQAYARRDDRIRYERLDQGIPVTQNFNRACRLSRGRYFKWQAHDDLLDPEYLRSCVSLLDEDPTTVLAAARVRPIDEDGSSVPLEAEKGMFVTSYGEQIPIPAPAGSGALDSPQRLQRFRSVLFDIHGVTEGEYVFGLFRSAALAATPLVDGGYFGADKVLLARLSLVGRFTEVAEELFLRRYHRGHIGARPGGTWSGRIRLAKALAPDRRFIVFPLARQVRGYVQAILDADITATERVRCGAMVLEKVAAVGVERAKRLPTRMREAFERG
jgi:glycosyltransferase involved in cell wall biosynthesis